MAGDEHRRHLTDLAGQQVEMGGSDLHIKVSVPPRFGRKDGSNTLKATRRCSQKPPRPNRACAL